MTLVEKEKYTIKISEWGVSLPGKIGLNKNDFPNMCKDIDLLEKSQKVYFSIFYPQTVSHAFHFTHLQS